MFGLRKRKRDRNVLLGLLEMLAFDPRNQLLLFLSGDDEKKVERREDIPHGHRPLRVIDVNHSLTYYLILLRILIQLQLQSISNKCQVDPYLHAA
jgi:hypothetical protein